MTIAEEIRSALVENIDEGYRDFHAKLVPTIDPARILGVRLPAQRAVAKTFKKDARLPEFLAMTAHDYVEENFGYAMGYFRFPEGVFSEQTLAVAAKLGYRSVFWSFAYADWDVDNPPDESEAFERITSSTHEGEIMLLHAVSKTNADILPRVIDDIRNQGYEFTTQL